MDMSTPPLHPWVIDPQGAIILQSPLRERLVLSWDGRPVTSVSGVDVGFDGEQALAAVVVLHYPDMTLLISITAVRQVDFPYIPGLLSFREGPTILAAWEKLTLKPDLLMFDGQGIAHPRGFGLAAHMGLWLNIPTIGVAKSRLYGVHSEVGPVLGDQSLLYDEKNRVRTLGAVVRTREKSKPLYISPGHLIDLENAVTFVRACCRGHRLPESIRLADQISKAGVLRG
jgi:deoxyribonuclease V